jgi:hypothetical protein
MMLSAVLVNLRLLLSEYTTVNYDGSIDAVSDLDETKIGLFGFFSQKDGKLRGSAGGQRRG